MTKKKKKSADIYSRQAFSELFGNNLPLPYTYKTLPDPVERLLEKLHSLPSIDKDINSIPPGPSNIFFDGDDIEVCITSHEDSSKDRQSFKVPKFCSQGSHSDSVLNVGFPVWDLAFSPPYCTKEHSTPFVALAVSGCAVSHPVSLTLTQPKDVSGTIVIQLWKIQPDVLGSSSTLTVTLSINGGFCRCLEWVRYSGYGANVGLLFATFGNGETVCYSVPAGPFLKDQRSHSTVKPIWRLSGPWLLRCVSPAPYFITPTREFSVEDKYDECAKIRIAGGSSEGRIFLWDWDGDCESSNVPFATFRIGDLSVVTSIAWAPTRDLTHLAVSTSGGPIWIWDVRHPVNGEVFNIEISRKPTYDIEWYILACHVSACIFNTKTKECHQRGPARNAATVSKTSIQERYPWACCSLGIMAVFSFDQGYVLFQPLNHLDRDSQKYSWVFNWRSLNRKDLAVKQNNTQPEFFDLSTDRYVSKGTALSLMESVKKRTAASLSSELLTNFYNTVEAFYTTGMHDVRENGLHIEMACDATLCRQKNETFSTVAETLSSAASGVRLHAIASLDPLIYNNCLAPLVAVGGSAGIVHILDAQKWKLHCHSN